MERKSLFVCWLQAIASLIVIGAYVYLCTLVPWLGVGTLFGLVSLLVACAIHDNQ